MRWGFFILNVMKRKPAACPVYTRVYWFVSEVSSWPRDPTSAAAYLYVGGRAALRTVLMSVLRQNGVAGTSEMFQERTYMYKLFHNNVLFMAGKNTQNNHHVRIFLLKWNGEDQSTPPDQSECSETLNLHQAIFRKYHSHSSSFLLLSLTPLVEKHSEKPTTESSRRFRNSLANTLIYTD